MDSDWTGNTKSVYSTLGASSHSNGDRQEHDYYATEPKAAEMLCDLIELKSPVWECACGGGHIADVLKEHGYDVKSTDLFDYGYTDGVGGVDFFECQDTYYGDIVTNPPYKFATEWTEHAMDIVADGYRVIMFLKLSFLETAKRRKLFEKYPPKYIYVSSNRLKCAKNGDFENTDSSAVCYAWFVWEKGFTGEPTVRWFN